MWQTGRSITLDSVTRNKVRRAGGSETTIEGQRVCANSPELAHRILQEKARRGWGQSRAINTRKELPWGDAFHEALKTQTERRGLDWSEVAISIFLRRIHCGEDGIITWITMEPFGIR